MCVCQPTWPDKLNEIILLLLLFTLCRLDFDTQLSSITTLLQSLLPSRPNLWLPATNPPYFTLTKLASLHFLSSPSCSPSLLPPSLPPPSFPPLSPLLYMAITCPYSWYIGLHCTTCTYTGRPGEPLTLSKAASNHVNVRPTSQCRAVSPAALVSAAALDCCWRWRFSQFFARWHIHISPP